MTRMICALVALVCIGWLSAPATAQQSMSDCDKWVARVNSEVGTRADEASHAARMKIDQIARMCKDGKTAEAEKAAKETMATLGDLRFDRATSSPASGARIVRSPTEVGGVFW